MLIKIIKIHPSDATYRVQEKYLFSILVIDKDNGDFITPLALRKSCSLPIRGSSVQGTFLDVKNSKELFQSILFFDVDFEIISLQSLTVLQKARFDKIASFKGD